MNQLHESNQLHFFTDNSDIPPEPHVVTELLTNLVKFKFMPTFGQAINALSGERKKFIVMITGDEKLRIEFQIDRIVISSEGKSLGSFFEQAKEIITTLAICYPTKKANRLSIINNSLYVGSNEEYNELYKKLFTYHEAEPFEWDNRIAEKKNLLNSSESLNCVSTIRRSNVNAAFHNDNRPFDAVIIESDINTIPESKNNRFELLSSLGVLNEMLEVSNKSRELLDRYFV